MGKTVIDMAISLDGFVATSHGRDGGLHDYFFKPSAETAAVIAADIRGTGAIIMGRRAYDLGVEHEGFADDPYKVLHVVVTHHVPPARPRGTEAFEFVTDGIEPALRTARTAAGDRDVVIGGGPAVARQYLKANLVDELRLHIVPKVLVRGLALFDTPTVRLALAPHRTVAAPDALHVAYLLERL